MKFKVTLEKDDIEDYKLTRAQVKNCQEYIEACIDDYLYDQVVEALNCWVENNLEYNED